VNKVDEIIGLDVTQHLLGQSIIQTHVEGVITEYYPENIGEFLIRKKRLLELAKKGNKKAKKQIAFEDLKKLGELVKFHMKETLGTEGKFILEDEEEEGE
jgi:hypothetical protein